MSSSRSSEIATTSAKTTVCAKLSANSSSVAPGDKVSRQSVRSPMSEGGTGSSYPWSFALFLAASWTFFCAVKPNRISSRSKTAKGARVFTSLSALVMGLGSQNKKLCKIPCNDGVAVNGPLCFTKSEV